MDRQRGIKRPRSAISSNEDATDEATADTNSQPPPTETPVTPTRVASKTMLPTASTSNAPATAATTVSPQPPDGETGKGASRVPKRHKHEPEPTATEGGLKQFQAWKALSEHEKDRFAAFRRSCFKRDVISKLVAHQLAAAEERLLASRESAAAMMGASSAQVLGLLRPRQTQSP